MSVVSNLHAEITLLARDAAETDHAASVPPTFLPLTDLLTMTRAAGISVGSDLEDQGVEVYEDAYNTRRKALDPALYANA